MFKLHTNNKNPSRSVGIKSLPRLRRLLFHGQLPWALLLLMAFSISTNCCSRLSLSNSNGPKAAIDKVAGGHSTQTTSAHTERQGPQSQTSTTTTRHREAARGTREHMTTATTQRPRRPEVDSQISSSQASLWRKEEEKGPRKAGKRAPVSPDDIMSAGTRVRSSSSTAATTTTTINKNLLVRQLSDLIMNNEPAAIQRELTRAQVGARLREETRRLTAGSSLDDGGAEGTRQETQHTDSLRLLLADDDLNDLVEDDEELSSLDADYNQDPDQTKKGPTRKRKKQRRMVDAATTSSTLLQTATSADPTAKRDWSWSSWLGRLFSAQNNEDGTTHRGVGGISGTAEAATSEMGGLLEDASMTSSMQFPDPTGNVGEIMTVTCSPDYEDPASQFEASEMTMDDLTAEQRQQLLGGVDSQGSMAPPSSGANRTGELEPDQELASEDPQQQHSQVRQMQAQHNQMVGQCIPASSRMIEIITKVVTPILFTIIIIVGLLGNIVVVCVLWEDKKLEREWTPTNLLILDLSIADLSFIIFCIPFTGWDYAVGHWVFGYYWCKANQYLIVVCALSSIYTLVLMSCDRYMAIVYPIECINYRTSRNMLKAIVIKWILILAIASPTVPMHGLIDSAAKPRAHSCRFLTEHYDPLHFQIIFFITSYFLPLALIFFLYLGLLRRLWRGQRPRGHKESHKSLESKKKITRLVAVIVIVFALCWCPIQVMLILMRLKSFPITATYVTIQVIAHTLGYMNSCVNPIIYAFASDSFYQSFKRSRLGRLCLKWLCCGHFPIDINSNNDGQHNTIQHHPNAHQFRSASKQSNNGNTSDTIINVNSFACGPGAGGRRNTSGATVTLAAVQSAGDININSTLPVATTNSTNNTEQQQQSQPPEKQEQEHDQNHQQQATRQQHQRQRQQPSRTFTSSSELIPRQPTAAAMMAVTKQQLVACVATHSSNTNGQGVSHNCQPLPSGHGDNGDNSDQDLELEPRERRNERANQNDQIVGSDATS